jgi:hypothetical protein
MNQRECRLCQPDAPVPSSAPSPVSPQVKVRAPPSSRRPESPFAVPHSALSSALLEGRMRLEKRVVMTVGACLSLFAPLLLGAQAPSGDWTQWRGPGRDGVVVGFTPPAKWPEQLTRRWQVEVGTGHATHTEPPGHRSRAGAEGDAALRGRPYFHAWDQRHPLGIRGRLWASAVAEAGTCRRADLQHVAIAALRQRTAHRPCGRIRQGRVDLVQAGDRRGELGMDG